MKSILRFAIPIIVGLFNIISVFSQEIPDSTERISERVGLSMGFLGVSPVMGPTFDVMMSEKTTFEIGFGVPGPGFGAGFKIHPNGLSPDTKNFHIGIEGGAIEGIGFIYFPVGISKYKIKGEYLSFDIGPAVIDGSYIPYVNFKVGIKF